MFFADDSNGRFNLGRGQRVKGMRRRCRRADLVGQLLEAVENHPGDFFLYVGKLLSES